MSSCIAASPIWIIYRITSPSGKSYIGQTRQKLSRRLEQHKSDAINRNSPSPIHAAIRKYGFVNFKVETLATCSSQQEADEQECNFIKQFDCLNSKCGYNAKEGGQAVTDVFLNRKRIAEKRIGRKHSEATIAKLKARKISEETKEKIRQTLKGRKPAPHVIENLLAMAKARIGKEGRKHSEEARRQMSETRKGRKPQQHVMENLIALAKARKGKKVSSETLEKMRIRAKERNKKVVCVESGIVYESVKSAASANNTSTSYISRSCKNGTSCKGFHFQYV